MEFTLNGRRRKGKSDMKGFHKIIIGCLVVIILIQGAGLALNFQQQKILTEKLNTYEEKMESYEEKMDKIDTLLDDTDSLFESVNEVMEDVKSAVENFSIFGVK